jgi:glycosidase
MKASTHTQPGMRTLAVIMLAGLLAGCEQGGLQGPVDVPGAEGQAAESPGAGEAVGSTSSPLSSTMFLRGTNNSWGTTAMSVVGGAWQVTATFGTATDERFKFDVAGDWATNYGGSGGAATQNGADIPITGGAGTYLITFSEGANPKTYTVVKQTGDTSAPTASVTSPGAGTVSGMVSLKANAADNVGVARVDFLAGTTVVATDNQAPYDVSWDSTTVANGAYTITAKAYDAAGNVGTSTGVNVTVSNSAFAHKLAQVYVRGTCNTWGTSEMRLVAANSWQVDVTFSGAAGDGFKFDMTGNWATNWGETGTPNGTADLGGGNIPVTGGAGTYRITLNDAALNTTTWAGLTYTVVKQVGDTTAPTGVAITAPAAGTISGSVTVSATASDNVGIAKVDFYAGANLIGTATTGTGGTYSITWVTKGDTNGAYTLTAKAYDTSNNVTTSAGRNVTVSNAVSDTTNPTGVAITSPAANATLNGPVTISANATDNVGVTKVEFYAGTTLLGTDTTPPQPFTLNWDTNTVPNGAYALTVKAYDAATNVTTSSAVNVTVSNSVSSGLIVHVKRPASWGTSLKIHYWNVVPTSVTATTWPGVAMTSEGSDWYKFTIAGATSASIVFNDGAGHQTADLSRTTAESWYYTDSQWYDVNPDAPKIPVVDASLAPGLYTQALNIGLAGSNADDTIYFTTDGTTPTTASTVYTALISVGTTMTIKTFGVNRLGQAGSVYCFAYTIDPAADITKPTVQPNIAEGYVGTGASVIFTVKDDKTATTKAYYTKNGTTPTTASTVYVQGNASGAGLSGAAQAITATVTYKFLVVDGAGNQTTASFSFTYGAAPARADFRKETIYFVITSRFMDGDSTNNVHCWDDTTAQNPDTDPCWRGDFAGLASKLDYIKALGFSAVWITPVVKNASGYDYHGYHAINHKEVDPRYATKALGETAEVSYKKLIDAAHAKGMKIIQDIVVNHTSNFGEENLYPMFKRNAPTGLTESISTALTKLTNPWLPANYDTLAATAQYAARISAMKEDVNDTQFIYHHEKSLTWEGYTVQTGQIAGDCVDINTENPTVQQYLVDAYNHYIDLGVDGFRIDTVKHVSRLSFNNAFIPQWKAHGGSNFYIFGEVATRYRQVWNNGIPAISAPFYTWKETVTYPWGNRQLNEASVLQNWNDNINTTGQPTSTNHALGAGNTYHTPDWTRRSGLDVIDFPMHWNFANARDAFSVAVGGDQYYSDATWNVTYVDSHDYAPDTAPENQRFALPQDTWAENLDLLFTFRGVPTILYGSEIEFKKGMPIDVGPNAPLENTGRAYFGNNMSGTLAGVTDFGVYDAANTTGNVATTLNHPLAQHIRRLNLIRRAVPALQTGEYGTDNISGSGIAFKRRYTDATTDSFALVVISGDATFSGIPNGTYVDAITGTSVNVTTGSLYATSTGKGNARIYVLNTALTPAPGKKGVDGLYLKP